MIKLSDWLLGELVDRQSAHAFLEERARDFFAAQVRTLRQSRGFSIGELSRNCGIDEGLIAGLEAGAISAMEVATLQKLARVLDVHLRIEFESAVAAADRVSHFTDEQLQVPSRADELRAYSLPLQAVTAMSRSLPRAPTHSGRR